MEITLSVLIPTTSARNEVIKPLLKNLDSQIRQNKAVELIINTHETDCIGKKRNSLLDDAIGVYVVFIDSDDDISEDYIKKILKACESNADCIGISGWITTDGKDHKKWHISKRFRTWYTRNNVYFRTPNHISPVKRELALKAKFPEIKFGEDYEYSMRLLPFLKTEVIVKGELYYYKYQHIKK